MRIAISIMAAAALIVGGGGAALAKHKMAHPAKFEIASTSYFYDYKGKPMQESVGPDGMYVTHSGATHIDHGTAVMKGSKVCFTSAMTKDGERCWTTHPTAIGGTMKSVSDKGEMMMIHRVKYSPPKM